MDVTTFSKVKFGGAKKPHQIILLSFWLCIAWPAYSWQTDEDVVEENSAKESLNQVKFMTQDGFMLAGKYQAGLSSASGVLLLHDCSHNSGSYDNLISILSEQGLHAFALDLRGFGASVSEEYSHMAIKRQTKDIVSYQSEISRLTAFWQSDVLSAYQFLRKRIDKDKDVAVVSSGCSAVQAIELAEKMRINSFVMITPELNYMQKESFKNLIDIPVYFIDSAYHADTYQTTKELFEWNGDSRSIFQIFKGIRHGHGLLNKKRYIAHDIALWLDDTLAK